MSPERFGGPWLPSSWHVVAVEPSSENRVKRRAADLQIEAYSPVGSRMARVRARRSITLQPRDYAAMPGYVFVRGGQQAQFRREWEARDAVPHCLRMLGVERPQSVPDAVVEGFKQREADGEFAAAERLGRYLVPRWLRAERRVLIVGGPLAGTAGRVWRMTAARTVALWVIMLGQETLAELPMDWVARAA